MAHIGAHWKPLIWAGCCSRTIIYKLFPSYHACHLGGGAAVKRKDFKLRIPRGRSGRTGVTTGMFPLQITWDLSHYYTAKKNKKNSLILDAAPVCFSFFFIYYCSELHREDWGPVWLRLFDIPWAAVVVRGRNLLGGPRARSMVLAWHVLGCLSKQIKGVRALKDDGGCFYVLPQAAVAPVGLEEWVMGLKHSSCSQMQGTLCRTSKCSIIYILVTHSDIF